MCARLGGAWTVEGFGLAPPVRAGGSPSMCEMSDEEVVQYLRKPDNRGCDQAKGTGRTMQPTPGTLTDRS